jgi:hypothetical protein
MIRCEGLGVKIFSTIIMCLAMGGCLLKKSESSKTLDISSTKHDHHHEKDSPGGPLLGGYPWGIFSLQTTFSKRVTFKSNDNEIALANKIFESLGSKSGTSIMVAFPLYLEHKGYRPFGDGQSNAQANFAQWTAEHPPFLALYDRTSKKTVLFINRSLTAGDQWKLTYMDGSSADFSLTPVDNTYPTSITTAYSRMATLELNQQKLNWDSLANGKALFFKPEGWQEGFAVKFQNPFVPVETLLKDVPQRFKNFSTNGKAHSVPNALKVSYNNPQKPLIELMDSATKSGYLTFTNDKVHAEYPNNNPGFIEKSVGGNWTFLANPNLWEKSAANASTFKQLYSCFAGRAQYEESIKKAVSGTSWHNVGDPGEYLINSVGGESRSLVAAIGEDLTTGALAPNMKLAFGLTHNGYSGFLEPNFAFISLNGQYHWHPVHTNEPICIEVWTPFCKYSENNAFGMNCAN